MIADCALVRRVVAERTVGGIKKGSILPAGLTFTVFVEWLLRGEPEPEDEDPAGVLRLNTVVPVGAPYAAELDFTITKYGTALPRTISFYERGTSTDTLLGTYDYVNDQDNYIHKLETLPDHRTEYYAILTYKLQYSETIKDYESNHVWYTPETPVQTYKIYGAAIPLEMEPTASEIMQMASVDVTDEALSVGVQINIPTSGYTTTIFIAVPMAIRDRIDWFAGDGTTHDNPPEPTTVTGVNNQSYAAYKWAVGYGIPQTFILKLKNQ